jgi:hypothetical protein
MVGAEQVQVEGWKLRLEREAGARLCGVLEVVLLVGKMFLGSSGVKPKVRTPSQMQ